MQKRTKRIAFVVIFNVLSFFTLGLLAKSGGEWSYIANGGFGGMLGGLALIVDRILADPSGIENDLTDAQALELLGRVMVGGFSGAALVALIYNGPIADSSQRLVALGFIAGFSGNVLRLLAKRLEKSIAA